MNNQTPSFPRRLKALLLASILLPISTFLFASSASATALLWSALIAALSLSIWVGKRGAARALAYIFYFSGSILLASLLIEFFSWTHSAFVFFHAVIHLTAGRQLLNDKELVAYLKVQSEK